MGKFVIGSIYAQPPDAPTAIVRVIGPNNQTERFTGSVAECHAVIARWRGERHTAKGKPKPEDRTHRP